MIASSVCSGVDESVINMRWSLRVFVVGGGWALLAGTGRAVLRDHRLSSQLFDVANKHRMRPNSDACGVL